MPNIKTEHNFNFEREKNICKDCGQLKVCNYNDHNRNISGICEECFLEARRKIGIAPVI